MMVMSDNLTAAKPLLQKFDIPATMFVCPAYLGREFWWEELERIIHESPYNSRYTAPSGRGEDHFEWNVQRANTKSACRYESAAIASILLHLLYNHLSPLGQKDREDALKRS
jgi:peptidoglycan/xylan/chitin deacetylase (PgdA/CDA1 family)